MREFLLPPANCYCLLARHTSVSRSGPRLSLESDMLSVIRGCVIVGLVCVGLGVTAVQETKGQWYLPPIIWIPTYPACNSVSACAGAADGCTLNGGTIVMCGITFSPASCVNSIGAVGGGVSICIGVNAQDQMCFKGFIGCSKTLPPPVGGGV